MLVPIHDGRPSSPLDWAVDDFVESSATTVFYGFSGTIKTFILLHLSLCIVTGREFFGHETKRGPVIYIAGEGVRSLKRRVEAWERHYGLLTDEDRSRFLYMVEDGRHVQMRVLDGSREGNPSTMVDRLSRLISEMTFEDPLRAIIFDTMATTFGMFEETNEQISKALATVNHDLAHKHRVAVVACHHTGKDQVRGARGGYSLVCDADAVYLVRRADLPIDKIPDAPFDYQNNRVLIECKKMKDAEAPETIEVGATRIILGKNDKDKEISSLVATVPSLSDRQERVLRWLKAMWSLKDIASECGITVKQTRDTINQLKSCGAWSDDQEAQRKLANRGGRPKGTGRACASPDDGSDDGDSDA